MKIEYVNHSIANNFGDVIEMNHHLIDYPDLHKAILDHELGHTKNPKFNSTDFAHDMKPTKVNQLRLLKFMILHPASFTQLLPFYYSKKWGITYDMNLIMVYVILIILLIIGFMIGMNL
jgi:hypothetical protein